MRCGMYNGKSGTSSPGRETIHKSLIILILMCASLTHADAASDGSAALTRFTEISERESLAMIERTQRYVENNEQGTVPVVRDELEKHCGHVTRLCFDYLTDNKALLLATLPSDPEYWQRLDDFLATGSLGVEAVERSDELRPLFDAAIWFHVRRILTAADPGFGQLGRIVMQSRQKLALSETLIENMMFSAVLGIHGGWINLALAKRTDSLGRLESPQAAHAFLQPLSVQEYSLRMALEGEARYIESMISKGPRTYEEWLANLEKLREYNPQAVEEMRANPPTDAEFAREYEDEQHLFEYFKPVLAQYVELSELPIGSIEAPSIYADIDLLLAREPDFADMALPYRSYIDYSTQPRLSQLVLAELNDMYSGRTTVGVPSRPPPISYQWLWRADSQDLCLRKIEILAESPEPHCFPYLAD